MLAQPCVQEQEQIINNESDAQHSIWVVKRRLPLQALFLYIIKIRQIWEIFFQ
jgi:hypothetical protein